MSNTDGKKIQASDLEQGVFDLFDEYAHSSMSRRVFIDKMSKYAVAGLTAAAIVDYLLPQYAEAVQIKKDDSRLRSETIEYDSPKGGGKIKKGAANKLPWQGTQYIC